MKRVLALLSVVLLCGCFDLAPADSDPGPETTGGETAAENDAPPTESDSGTPKSFDVTPGEGVTVSGSISYEGKKSGKIRIDVLGQKDKQMFELLTPLGLEDWGEWSFEAPKNYGAVKVVGFLDQTGDGPSEDDAAMIWEEPLVVGEEDITGIDLVLGDKVDLSSLTPGAGGGEAPPPPPENNGEGDTGAPDGDPQPTEGAPEPEEGGEGGEAPKAE